MDPVLAVIQEVEQECRDRRIPMLGREKARFLAELVRKSRPRLVVECGTAIGYSALWIARTLRDLGRGRLITIEIDPKRSEEARGHLERAGLLSYVELWSGDACELVSRIQEPVDFVHLDNGYGNYYPCFRALEPRLVEEAVIVADNVGIGAEAMQDYLDYVRKHYPSETYWFTVNLPWVRRDAMEVTVYRK
ncbi:MAG: hypothetical protein KatS3mg115_0792 [Candidatus Poribacteria bacterium]|nr:MAG: hypothetical protein KatS3mg115_0792 [Candidatus Poribacteria bacterium]